MHRYRVGTNDSSQNRISKQPPRSHRLPTKIAGIDGMCVAFTILVSFGDLRCPSDLGRLPFTPETNSLTGRRRSLPCQGSATASTGPLQPAEPPRFRYPCVWDRLTRRMRRPQRVRCTRHDARAEDAEGAVEKRGEGSGNVTRDSVSFYLRRHRRARNGARHVEVPPPRWTLV